MNRKRQTLLQLCSFGVTLAAGSMARSQGQNRVLVPFQRGGISSLLARTLASGLNQLKQQNWIKQHVPGYSNMTAVRELLQAANQGQWDVMIAGPTVLTIGDSMNPFMSVNAESELKVLLGLIQGPMVLISHTQSDLDDWKKIKQSKRRLRIGVSGLGSPAHFVAAHMDKSVFALGDAYNTDGDLPSMQKLARGELDLAVISIGSLLPPLEKSYRVLLTSGAEPILWDKQTIVPTMASIAETREAQSFSFDNWLSVCASAQMPLQMLQALTKSLSDIRATGAFAAVASSAHHQVMQSTPSDMQQQIYQSRVLLEKYILRAQLSNTLGLELTH
jgi:tripartite-type tricarboxylate transporter receptor subunit TctC